MSVLAVWLGRTAREVAEAMGPDIAALLDH